MVQSKVILIFLFIIFPLQFQTIALAEYAAAPATKEWKIIESKYCTILCDPDVDIIKVNNKIKIRFYDIDWGRYSSKNKSVEEQLAEKFDCIFQKVEKILDMFPRKIHPKVKICRNQAQLDDTFAETFGYANAKARSSYYVHKYTTIYTTQQTISQGVLAHEMGHAVIDHYFLILPPEKVSELLTQYVEMHLED